ncbi:MAG: extracellular solute-binding protein [Deltaproteobacteria bacterium]|nr:extracellular solute-binding protein [Deltaproteobacteria bacterium]
MLPFDPFVQRLIVSARLAHEGAIMKRFVAIVVCLFLGTSLATANNHDAFMEGAKKERELTLYTSMTVDQAQRLNNAFTAKYPFLQINMFRAVGERLLTKIMTEAQAGRFGFDVVQSAETQGYFLKKRGLLGRYQSPEVKNLQKGFADPEGYWAAIYMMPNVIAYNTRMVKRNEVPVSDDDLLNPKWRGKIGMDGTKPEWFSWKLRRMGQEKGLAYMKKLGAQEFRLYSGLTIITGLLAAGEFPLVLNTYVHNAEDAKRKGAPVEWVAQDPVFTKFQPIGVGSKAPHPNAAKLFVDFMLSDEGQKIIASFGRVPTRRGVPTTVQGLEKLNFVIDEFSAGDDFNKSYEQFRNIFGTAK